MARRVEIDTRERRLRSCARCTLALNVLQLIRESRNSGDQECARRRLQEGVKMAYVVPAKWTAREGEEEAVAAAIRQMIGPTRAEPGVFLYQPHRDPGNPRLFVLYEQYVDEAAYAAHATREHVKQFGFGDAIPRLERREREIYETWEP